MIVNAKMYFKLEEILSDRNESSQWFTIAGHRRKYKAMLILINTT